MDKSLDDEFNMAVEAIRQGALDFLKVLSLAGQLNAAGKTTQTIMLYNLWIQAVDSPFACVAYFNLGLLLSNDGDLKGAEEAYQKAIALKPDFIQAYANLGSVFERAGRYGEALKLWHLALTYPLPENKSLYVHLLNQTGRLSEQMRLYPEAEELLRRSLCINSYQPDTIQHWVHLRQKQCKWPVYTEVNDLLLPDLVSHTSPMAMLGLSNDPAMQLYAARRMIEKKCIKNVETICKTDNYGHDKLRIGYLSSNFNIHAVSMLTAELYELHNRDKVEVYGFCWSGEDVTGMRNRVSTAMDHYIRIVDMSDEAAAHCILSHEIDILVDLQGITGGARVNILLYKPAPIQITYLGYPGSTAIPTIDYVIADKFVLPEELTPFFSEKPLYMPDSFQCSDRHRVAAQTPTRSACGLPDDKFVFCSFNNNFKFTTAMYAVWMSILQRVPDSVLWLLADNEWSREHLCLYAEQHGVDRGRLIFAPRVSPTDYLARYRVADLFLDTFPYNGGTTANDVLWMCLPLLTYSGRTFVSRMAGSLLTSLGLPELITYSLSEYEEKAVSLATNPEKVVALRRYLEETHDTCRLFDMPQFVHDLEVLFEQVAGKQH